MRRIKIFVLVSLLLFSQVYNLTFANEAVTRKMLDNGLICLVKESPPKDLVTIVVTVRASPLYEEEYLGRGISHLTEHMLFKGTKTRKQGEIEKEVRSYGGLIDGSVSSDFTSYQLTVPPQYFSRALSLLKDMLLNAVFDGAELEKEKEVIVKEIKLGKDEPLKKIILSLFSNAYIRHPYRYPVIGFEGPLKALTREDVIRYYDRRYTPNNIIVAVVGGINEDDAILQIEKEFRDFRKPCYREANAGIAEPAQLGKKEAREGTSTTLAYLAIGYHSTGLLNKDLFAMDILSLILGRGNNSRLNTALVKEARAVHSVSASNFTPEDAGLFIITAIMDKDNIERSQKIIREEIEKIRNGDINDKELEAAKKMLSSDYILSRETIQEQAKDFSESELMAGNYDFSRRYIDGIKRITKFDVRRAAMQYLNDDNMTEVILLPSDNSSLKIHVPKPGTLEERIEKKVLPNGLIMLARRDTKIPAASITVAFSGGLMAENKKNNGISGFVSRMILDGTKNRNEAGIKGTLEALGGEITSFSGLNSIGLNITILKEDIDFAFELIRDIAFDSIFPDEEIAKEKMLAAASIKDEDDDIFQKGALLFRKNLFGDYPYGMRYAGEIETVSSFKRDELMNFYRAYFVPNNAVISVSGDIEPKDIFQKVESLFKDLPRRELPKMPSVPLPDVKIKTAVFRMDKEETLLMAGFMTTTIGSPDRYALEVLNTLLSGMSGRLFASIRDKSGLSYALGCVQKLGVNTGYMLFYVATTKDKLQPARNKLFDEIKLIRENIVTDNELDSAKREILSSYRSSMQANAAYSFQSALDELYGLGFNNTYKYEEGIKKVAKEDVKRVADKYLNLNACAEIVIEPSI